MPKDFTSSFCVANLFLSSNVGVKLVTCFLKSCTIPKLFIKMESKSEKNLTSNHVVSDKLNTELMYLMSQISFELLKSEGLVDPWHTDLVDTSRMIIQQ